MLFTTPLANSSKLPYTHHLCITSNLWHAESEAGGNELCVGLMTLGLQLLSIAGVDQLGVQSLQQNLDSPHPLHEQNNGEPGQCLS